MLLLLVLVWLCALGAANEPAEVFYIFINVTHYACTLSEVKCPRSINGACSKTVPHGWWAGMDLWEVEEVLRSSRHM